MKRDQYKQTGSGARMLASRDKKGRITDVVSHKRSSRQDQRMTTTSEAEARVVRAAIRYVRIVRKESKAMGLSVTTDTIFGNWDEPIARACDKLTAARLAARKRRVGK